MECGDAKQRGLEVEGGVTVNFPRKAPSNYYRTPVHYFTGFCLWKGPLSNSEFHHFKRNSTENQYQSECAQVRIARHECDRCTPHAKKRHARQISFHMYFYLLVLCIDLGGPGRTIPLDCGSSALLSLLPANDKLKRGVAAAF